MVKVLSDAKTDRILGVHIIGSVSGFVLTVEPTLGGGGGGHYIKL